MKLGTFWGHSNKCLVMCLYAVSSTQNRLLPKLPTPGLPFILPKPHVVCNQNVGHVTTFILSAHGTGFGHLTGVNTAPSSLRPKIDVFPPKYLLCVRKTLLRPHQKHRLNELHVLSANTPGFQQYCRLWNPKCLIFRCGRLCLLYNI